MKGALYCPSSNNDVVTYEGLLKRKDRHSPGDEVFFPLLEYDDLPNTAHAQRKQSED